MSEGGGSTVDQCGETTRMRIACSCVRATATVTTSRTNPHHVPSARQPRLLHALRMRTKLTSGMTMPMDFSASLVHNVQRESIVNQIVDNPSTASVDASAANCVGESPAGRAIGKLTSESGKADMNFGALKCREFGATKCIARKDS